MCAIHHAIHRVTVLEEEDKDNIMEIIEVTAPLELEQLKKYFVDKNVFYIIDYDNSELKGELLLTYLSNLEIPCDVKIQKYEDCMSLLLEYMKFKQILNLPLLEEKMIDVLFQYKEIIEKSDTDFINANKEILQQWTEKLDSLSLYNMWIINEDAFKDFVKQFPVDATNSIEGINFVSLLKHEHFYMFYNIVDEKNLKFFETYFEEYMFKGNNLYEYWANSNNPMFLLNWAISSDSFNVDEYNAALLSDTQELSSFVSHN